MPEPRSDTDSWAKFLDAGSLDADDPIFTRRVPHRFYRVHHKVQNDLLKLDAVAEYRKRFRRDHTNQLELLPDAKR
jgi:hypothetical protein